jgi:hypothetical protein
VRLLLEAETPVVTIYGKTWLLHVKEVLRTTPDENLAMIADTVRFLKDHGKFVVYDAEHAFDGFKDNPNTPLATWQAAEKAGADMRGAVRHQRRLVCRGNRHHRGGPRPLNGKNRASTRTTTSAWAWPTRWRRLKPARRTCKAPSTVTANAPAIAT